MFSTFARKKTVAAPAATSTEPAAPAPDLRGAIGSIGRQASQMGREAAEVRGLMEDTQKVSARQAQAINELAGQVREITRAQDAIGQVSQGSLGAVERARRAVEDVGSGVNAIVATLRQVSQA